MSDENLIPFEKPKRAKKRGDKPKGEKIPKDVIYVYYSNLLMGRVTDFPAPFKYHVVAHGQGDKFLLYEIENKIVTPVSNQHLIDNLIAFAAADGDPEMILSPHHARETALTFIARSPVIPEPAPFKWADEPGLAYHVLPWEKGITGPTPTWDALTRRFSNSAPFMYWLGSLFVEGSYLQQYVWMYGEGGDGKGAINRFLAKVFGRAYRSTRPPKGDHWGEGLVGKRLVVFPDCNSRAFVTGGEFKVLSGDDPVEVNPKYRAVFTYVPRCKYLFLSNEHPAVSSEKADLRRIILCEFDPKAPKIDSEAFEEDLWREGGAFLTKCIEGYLSRCERTKPIPCESAAIEDLAAEHEIDFSTAFEAAFFLSPTVRLKATEMQEFLRAWWPQDRKTWEEFKAWLSRTHGIRYKSYWDIGGRREYRGLTFKKNWNSRFGGSQ